MPRTLVVISYFDQRPKEPLGRLLDSITRFDAGAEYDCRIVVNSTRRESISLSERHSAFESVISYRENTGMNIGAWDFGWRANPHYDYYLFLQDECLVVQDNWLRAFQEAADHPDVGMVGESMNLKWNQDWESIKRTWGTTWIAGHYIDGSPADRVTVYQKFMHDRGIPFGETGRHLRSLVWFLRNDVLTRINGFPIGNNLGECIAAEIAVTKMIEARGLQVTQVAAQDFCYIQHCEWQPGSQLKKAAMSQVRTPPNGPTCKLTVCLPATDATAPYLDEVLNRLLMQTGGADVEVIILDYSGLAEAQPSSQRTLRYVACAQEDSPDQLLARCLEVAQGRFCWIQNGYDVLRTGAIARILAALEDTVDILVLNSILTDIWLKPRRRLYALDENIATRRFDLQTEADWLAYLGKARSTSAVFGYQTGIVFAVQPMRERVTSLKTYLKGNAFEAGVFSILLESGRGSLTYLQEPMLYNRSTAIAETSGKLGEQIVREFSLYCHLVENHLAAMPDAREALIANALRGSHPWAWSDLSLGSQSWRPLRDQLTSRFKLERGRWFEQGDGGNSQHDYKFSTIAPLLAFQVHNKCQADEFARGAREISVLSLRHEAALIYGVYKLKCFDFLLANSAVDRLFNLLAVFIDDEGTIYFPETIRDWPEAFLKVLSDRLRDGAGQLQHKELRNFPVASSGPIDIEKLHVGRAIPCLADYATMVHHIKRYRFAREHLQAGRVLDCACGAGYGASILLQRCDVTDYVGVDLDASVLDFAKRLIQDNRCAFRNIELSSENIGVFENVVSLETIEHVPDPDAFLCDLASKMAPNGQIILSLPVERWGGTHRNPCHLTNWTYARFRSLVERHFEDCTIFRQKLSKLGPDTFTASEIVLREHVAGEDEGFIAILKRPHMHEKRRIFLRRRNALGDVLLTTPIVRALRQQYPESIMLVATNCTEAYQNNPHVDVLGNMQLRPRSGDLLIDLDGCYEQYRSKHILESYAASSPAQVIDWRPVAFPDEPDMAPVVALIRQAQWPRIGIRHLIGVHMAAKSVDRIWPLDHWKRWFERALAEPDVGIILVGSGSDFDATKLDLTPQQNARVLSLVAQAPVQMTAAALSLCDFLVAPDSGMAHLASAVGVRSLVLYGMADPQTRLPLDGGGEALWTPVQCRGCLMELKPEASPVCKFGRGQAFCMDAISADSVWLATRRLMDRTQASSWRIRANFPASRCQPTTSQAVTLQAEAESRSGGERQSRRWLRWLLPHKR